MDEFAETFAKRAIYSIGDLYSRYVDSRDITTMRTPIVLVQLFMLPQGARNLVTHMMNVMNKVLRYYILKITMPLLDDIPIKGCAVEKNTRLGMTGDVESS